MAEVLFAVTSMLSFTRLAYILPAHETLGTLQISIGKMIDDMIRCAAVVLLACTCPLPRPGSRMLAGPTPGRSPTERSSSCPSLGRGCGCCLPGRPRPACLPCQGSF